MISDTEAGRFTTSVGPFDDTCSKRFYFGRHQFLVDASSQTFKVNTSNDFPSNARIVFSSSDANDKVYLKIRVFLTNFDMRLVSNGVEKAPLTDRLPTLADPSGTYTFDARNTFHLIAQGSSTSPHQVYDLRTIDVIKLNLTFSISIGGFFDESQLISNLATLLDIPASRIKVVDVHPVNIATVKKDAADRMSSSEQVQESLSIPSFRRRSEDGMTATLAIGNTDNGTSSVPTTDSEQAGQDAYFNAIITTFTGAAISGALKSSLAAGGIVLESVAIQPPASFGLSQASGFTLEVDSTPSKSDDELDMTALAVGVAAGMVLVVVVTLLMRRHHQNRTRGPTKQQQLDKSVDVLRSTSSASSAAYPNVTLDPQLTEAIRVKSSTSLFGRIVNSMSKRQPSAGRLERVASRRGLQPIVTPETNLTRMGTIKKFNVASVADRIRALQEESSTHPISRRT
jgi:hypothetical protein